MNTRTLSIETPEKKIIKIGPEANLVVIAGPCVIESQEHSLDIAQELKKISAQLGVEIIFKASFDKANRSSIDSYRGPGIEEGKRILEAVKAQTNMLITTDIHQPSDAHFLSETCDILQIPAFLCRQTDLIVAAGKTKCVVNVKKGQFLAPWDCKNIISKLSSVGCENIILTERGVSFGYNNLVSDMRSIPIMQELGVPVCFDASHSLQLPGGQGKQSGGLRQYIPHLAKAAVAAGADCIFIECHDRPKQALSDANSVYPLDQLSSLLKQLLRIREIINQTINE